MSRRLSILGVLVLVVSGLAVVPASTAADSATQNASSATTAGCSYPVTETDATGTEVTVSERPDRITVLGPSAAQTVWELGRADSVIGMPVNKYTNYLGGTEGKVNIKDGFSTDTEKVVGTNPDIVVAANIISNKTITKLRDAGLTVFKFEKAKKLDDIAGKTRMAGRLIGACDTAEQVASNTTATIERIRSQVDGRDRPTVYFPQTGGFTPGDNTFINDAIETAGGNNLAKMSGIDGYGKISQEVIANTTVDWIVLTIPRGNLRTATNNTKAMREGNVLEIDPNLISQPAPRVTVPISQMANAFHPEANTTNVTAPPPKTSVADAETTSGNSPGFGVVAAVLALVATALIAARQR